MSTEEIKLKVKLELREHEFLWANISQRNRNSWSMGAFFVPISLLILAYAITAEHISLLDAYLLLLASVSSHFAWLILYLRNNAANRTYAQRIRNIEDRLKKKYGIIYKPLSETDARRKEKFWLRYGFPEYVWAFVFVLLIILWIIFIHSRSV